jgi:hypothetical protein
VSLQADGRLAMAFLAGTCPAEPGGLWVARRVLSDLGLPGRLPGARPPHAVACPSGLSGEAALRPEINPCARTRVRIR